MGGEEAECDARLHEACRSVLGVVAWTVLTRAELAVYVQAFQRRAQAPRINDCTGLIIVSRYMMRRKCCWEFCSLQLPTKVAAFTGAAFKAQP